MVVNGARLPRRCDDCWRHCCRQASQQTRPSCCRRRGKAWKERISCSVFFLISFLSALDTSWKFVRVKVTCRWAKFKNEYIDKWRVNIGYTCLFVSKPDASWSGVSESVFSFKRMVVDGGAGTKQVE